MSASGPLPIRVAWCSRSPTSAASSPCAGSRRRQAQQAAALRVVQFALRRHRFRDVIGQRPFRPRPVVRALQNGRALPHRPRLSSSEPGPQAPASYHPAAPETGPAAGCAARQGRAGGPVRPMPPEQRAHLSHRPLAAALLPVARRNRHAQHLSAPPSSAFPAPAPPGSANPAPADDRPAALPALRHRDRPAADLRSRRARRPTRAAAMNWRRRCAGSRRTHW